MPTKLRLYIADLWCFVREATPGQETFWAFAPNTANELPPYQHTPYLFFCDERPTGPTENYPNHQGQNERVWNLDGCELSFPGLNGALDQRGGDGPTKTTPDPENCSLDWLIKFEELATTTTTAMGPSATLKSGNGHGAIQARLKLQRGEIRVLKHTRVNNPAGQAAGMYFEYDPNGIQIPSGLPENDARPVGLWLVAEMNSSTDFIEVMRTPLLGGIPQVARIEPRPQATSIDLVLVNIAGAPGQGLHHFPLLYPLINGWTEPHYVPLHNQNGNVPLALPTQRESAARQRLLRRMSPSVADFLEPFDNSFSTDSKNCIPAVSDGFVDVPPLITETAAATELSEPTEPTKDADPTKTPKNQTAT